MSTKCKEILEELAIPCNYIEGHEPVLNYEAAARVDEQYHLTGKESKCLMMKTKSGQFVLFVTYEGVRMDRKYMKNLLGEKTSVCSGEELMEVSGYAVGCAAPFAYPDTMKYIVDNRILGFEKYLCSAGTPTESFEMETHYLKEIYENLGCDVTYIDDYPEEV